MHFTIPWNALCLHITTHALEKFFSKRTFNARSGKRMFNKTPVLCTLLDLRKTCVNERVLNMRGSTMSISKFCKLTYKEFYNEYFKILQTNL